MDKVHISVYRSNDGVETRIAPEKPLTIEEAIEFLTKLSHENKLA